MKNKHYIDIKMYAFKICSQSIACLAFLCKALNTISGIYFVNAENPGPSAQFANFLHTPHTTMWNLLCSVSPLITVTLWQAPLLHIYVVIYFFI